jgi:hypothetical protein
MLFGYSFLRTNSGGMGAMLYAILVALAHARCNNMRFVFILEDLVPPRLNGSVRDTREDDVVFTTYFRGFPIALRESCNEVWGKQKPEPTEYYELVREVYALNEETRNVVEERISASGFTSSVSVALHIRRTDKIFGSNLESGNLPLVEYVKTTVDALKHVKDPTVFVCTDDATILEPLRAAFASRGIATQWDISENRALVQTHRIEGTLEKTVALEDNITALKCIEIMSRAPMLIGGRCSYLFRIAELIRARGTTINIKDNEVFGVAPYANGEPFANPFWPKRYKNFITDHYLTPHTQELAEHGVVTILNFVAVMGRVELEKDVLRFNQDWWKRAVKDGPEVKYFDEKTECEQIIKRARQSPDFTYDFYRTGNHYATCVCFACRLRATFESYEILSFLRELTQSNVSFIHETFASRYIPGSFLKLHEDANKGRYAFVLSLSPPEEGGDTVFSRKNGLPWKTVAPMAFSLTVFSIVGANPHEVKEVVSGERIAFTGWFS